MSEKTLRICHLYPDLLNLYGDRGNILCMRRRLEWRGIGAEVTEVTVGQQADFTQFDLFFIGGGQDFEQEVLLSDLKAGKGDEIKAAIGVTTSEYDREKLQERLAKLRRLPDAWQLLPHVGWQAVRLHRRDRLLHRRLQGAHDRQFPL